MWQSKVVKYFEKIELSIGFLPIDSFASLKEVWIKELIILIVLSSIQLELKISKNIKLNFDFWKVVSQMNMINFLFILSTIAVGFNLGSIIGDS